MTMRQWLFKETALAASADNGIFYYMCYSKEDPIDG